MWHGTGTVWARFAFIRFDEAPVSQSINDELTKVMEFLKSPKLNEEQVQAREGEMITEEDAGVQ